MTTTKSNPPTKGNAPVAQKGKPQAPALKASAPVPPPVPMAPPAVIDAAPEEVQTDAALKVVNGIVIMKNVPRPVRQPNLKTKAEKEGLKFPVDTMEIGDFFFIPVGPVAATITDPTEVAKANTENLRRLSIAISGCGRRFKHARKKAGDTSVVFATGTLKAFEYTAPDGTQAVSDGVGCWRLDPNAPKEAEPEAA